VLDVT